MATTRFATPPRVKNSKKPANSPHQFQTNDPLLAQARAVADTLHQLESGHIPKGGVKLPLFNKDGTDFANPPAPVRPAPKPAPTRRSTDSSLPDLARHRRKCVVCNHPDREEIEEQFLHWRHPGYIAHDFGLEDDRYIHRHAHAVGLYARRRENYLFTLENLLERGDEIELTATAYIKAVRAYACMCDTVRWTEPAIRVIGLRDHSSVPVPALSTEDNPHGQGTASAVPSTGVNSGASAPEGISPAPSSYNPHAGLRSGRSGEAGAGTPSVLGVNNQASRDSSSPPKSAVDNPATSEPAQSPNCEIRTTNKETDEASSASLLPHAAFDDPATPKPMPIASAVGSTKNSMNGPGGPSLLPQAALDQPAAAKPAPPSGEPDARDNPHFQGTANAARLTGVEAGSSAPKGSAPPAPEADVVVKPSLLPQAALDQPAPAPSAPSAFSEARFAEQEKPIVVPCTTLPEAAFDKPATAEPEPSPNREIRIATRQKDVAVPASSLPKAALNQPAAAKQTPPTGRHANNVLPTSSLQPPTSSISNRPSPRLETGVSDRKQRKEANSNRP